MGDGGGWRRTRVLLLLPIVAAFAGCSGSGGSSGPASGTAGASAAAAASTGLSTAEKLRDALLTRVNGIAAAAPSVTGKYASLPAPDAKKTAAGTVQVTPAGCTGSALAGFNPAALAGATAATVSFRVATNDVSEVLISSSEKAAVDALAGQVPAKCGHYEEKVDGKTFKYTVKETTLTGIGSQARVLNVHAVAAASEEQWSLVYRGTGFVGSVTVIGPNASEAAVRELGQQAYAYAVKSLSYAKGHD